MSKISPEDAKAQLVHLRSRIDSIDDSLLDVLVERFEITGLVGQVKRDGGLPPADPDREEQMYKRLRAKAAERKLDPDVIEDVYRALISHVVKQHQQN